MHITNIRTEAVVRYLPVKERPQAGDVCQHSRYGIGLLRAVNPHMGTYHWDSMWSIDPSFPVAKRSEISFCPSERIDDGSLVKLEAFACVADDDDEETEPRVLAKIVATKKRLSYGQEIHGEIVDGQFRIVCGCCQRLL